MKQCTYCQEIKNLDEFSPGTAKFGRQSRCKKCLAKLAKIYGSTEKGKAYQQQYWKSEAGKDNLRKYRESEKGRQTARKYIHSENGSKVLREYNRKRRIAHRDMYRARNVVNNAVADGILPKISTQKCVHCNKSAQDYHHYKGYDKENWLAVEPVCRKCHRILEKKSPNTLVV